MKRLLRGVMLAIAVLSFTALSGCVEEEPEWHGDHAYHHEPHFDHGDREYWHRHYYDPDEW